MIEKLINLIKKLLKLIGIDIEQDTPSHPSKQVPKDLRGVVWLHQDVSNWAETAKLNTIIHSNAVEVDYDKSNVWKGVNTAGAFVNANPWIFVYKDGVWYAGTWEWLRYGQTVKSKSAVAGDHIKASPLHDFNPIIGETYGFMVSGLARSAIRNVKERSNVVMVTWK